MCFQEKEMCLRNIERIPVGWQLSEGASNEYEMIREYVMWAMNGKRLWFSHAFDVYIYFFNIMRIVFIFACSNLKLFENLRYFNCVISIKTIL